MEEHESYDSMDALDDVGDSQVSHNAESRTADTESESIAAAHAAAVHHLLRLLVRLITYTCLLHWH